MSTQDGAARSPQARRSTAPVPPSVARAGEVAGAAGLAHGLTLVRAGRAALAGAGAESGRARCQEAPGFADVDGDVEPAGMRLDRYAGRLPGDRRSVAGRAPSRPSDVPGAISSRVAAAEDAGGLRRPRPSRPSTGWDALTGRERTVAELAATGLTNAQIALALGVATATVKAHLRRVFAKLGIESRARLAAQVYGLRRVDAAAYSPDLRLHPSGTPPGRPPGTQRR